VCVCVCVRARVCACGVVWCGVVWCGVVCEELIQYYDCILFKPSLFCFGLVWF